MKFLKNVLLFGTCSFCGVSGTTAGLGLLSSLCTSASTLIVLETPTNITDESVSVDVFGVEVKFSFLSDILGKKVAQVLQLIVFLIEIY